MGRYDSPASTESVIRDIQTRLRRIETTLTTIQVASGAPTDSPADGALRGDKVGNFIYIRLNGAWKKVAVA